MIETRSSLRSTHQLVLCLLLGLFGLGPLVTIPFLHTFPTRNIKQGENEVSCWVRFYFLYFFFSPTRMRGCVGDTRTRNHTVWLGIAFGSTEEPNRRVILEILGAKEKHKQRSALSSRSDPVDESLVMRVTYPNPW